MTTTPKLPPPVLLPSPPSLCASSFRLQNSSYVCGALRCRRVRGKGRRARAPRLTGGCWGWVPYRDATTPTKHKHINSAARGGAAGGQLWHRARDVALRPRACHRRQPLQHLSSAPHPRYRARLRASSTASAPRLACRVRLEGAVFAPPLPSALAAAPCRNRARGGVLSAAPVPAEALTRGVLLGVAAASLLDSLCTSQDAASLVQPL